jgi:hypothetical protein
VFSACAHNANIAQVVIIHCIYSHNLLALFTRSLSPSPRPHSLPLTLFRLLALCSLTVCSLTLCSLILCSLAFCSLNGRRYPNGTSLSDDTWISSFHYKCVSESAGCLWDVVTDMHETTEVSASHPDIVDMMAQMLEVEKATIFSVSHDNDPACKPYCMQHYGGFYGPWKEV